MTNGTRRGWGISVTPRPLFTPGKDQVPIVKTGWAPGPVWTGVENQAPTGIRSLDRPARSQLLYRVRYPAHIVPGEMATYIYTNVSTYMGKKVQCTHVHALRLCTGRTAHRGSRGIALLFHDHGTRRGWGISVTPRPLFTPGKDPVPIVQETGWGHPVTGLFRKWFCFDVSFCSTRPLTLRLLMSYIYIYGAPILDVTRSHTTTHHSR